MAVGLTAVNAMPFVLQAPPATAVIENVGDSNILPDRHIERLVAEERRASTGKNDLLDSAKPSE